MSRNKREGKLWGKRNGVYFRGNHCPNCKYLWVCPEFAKKHNKSK